RGVVPQDLRTHSNLERAGEHSLPDGSTIGVGGSGRLWVRGQSCKLTGCTAAINGESFPPDASGPRAPGKGCHALPATASIARPAEPASPEARGETRLAAGEFETLHDAQTAIAREHGLSSWT